MQYHNIIFQLFQSILIHLLKNISKKSKQIVMTTFLSPEKSVLTCQNTLIAVNVFFLHKNARTFDNQSRTLVTNLHGTRIRISWWYGFKRPWIIVISSRLHTKIPNKKWKIFFQLSSQSSRKMQRYMQNHLSTHGTLSKIFFILACKVSTSC